MSREEREIDGFDNLDTWYAALRNENKQVIGTWRALPTTGDYMLRSIFPEMTRGEPLPEDKRIWEISRFAIDKTKRTVPDGRTYICQESKTLIQSFYDFSHQHDINKLVAVTSVAAERMMKKLGVNLRRLGDGKAIRIGKVLTTAVLIDMPGMQEKSVESFGYKAPMLSLPHLMTHEHGGDKVGIGSDEEQKSIVSILRESESRRGLVKSV